MQFTYGNVKVTTPTGITRPLIKGEAVNEGDSITTALTSSTQIKMMDGGLVAVRPDTKMKFDKFVFNGKQDGTERGYFTLVKGGFRAVTGLVGRANKHNYKISTPTATIGIRGTDHETYVVAQGAPNAAAGAYSKVNVGETTLTTNKGTVNVLPNQMGFSSGLNELPKLQPINTNLFTVSAAPTKTIKETKQEKKDADEKKEAEKQSTQETKQATKEENKKESTQETKQDTAQDTKQTTKPAATTTAATETTPPPATSDAKAGGTATSTTPAPPESPATVTDAAPLRTDTKMDAPANILAVTAAAPIAVQAPVVETVATPVTPAVVEAKPVVTVAMTDTSGNTLDATNQTVTTATDLVATVSAVVEVIAANANPANPTAPVSIATAVAKVINPVVTDTIANLLNDPSVTLNTDVVVLDAATLAQLASLKNKIGTGVLTYSSVIDNLANLNTNAGSFVATGTTVIVSDTLANLIANTPGYSIAGKNVVVTDAASIAQLAALDTTNGTGNITATTVTDSATNLASNTGGYVAAGKNVSVTGLLTIAQLTAIDIANGGGLLTYTTLSDSVAALSGSTYVKPGVNVTVTDTASLAQLATLAGKNSGGTLDATFISDTVAGLSTSTYVKPGVNVKVTDTATLLELSTLDSKNTVGTLNYTLVGDTVANLTANTGGYPVSGINLKVTDVAAIAELLAISKTNPTGTVTATTISDTAANLKSNFGFYGVAATNVIVTNAVSLADLASIDSNAGVVSYKTILDKTSNVIAGIGSYVVPGKHVTLTDAATVAELSSIDGANGTGTSSGTLTYTELADAAATLNGSAYVTPGKNVTITDAATVAQLTTIDGANGIGTSSGTLTYTALVDAAAILNGSTYVTLGKNVTITDAATVAQLSNIDGANGSGTSSGTLVYTALADSVANLNATAGNYLVAGKNVAVNDTGSLAQLAALDAVNGAGTLSFTTVNNANATHRVLFEPTVTGGMHEGYLWADNPVAATSTTYVFDANKNLTQIQGTNYETRDQTALVQALVNSNIVFNGGTSTDSFAATDGSIYMGRWTGGSLTVTDLALTNPLAPFTVNANPNSTSTHWLLAQMPAEVSPGVSLVKNMVGTANYTKTAATRPTDSFGNVGSVTAASLIADFTTQTLATTARFTFSSTDPVNKSTKNRVFDIDQSGITFGANASSFQSFGAATLPSAICNGADCSGSWFVGLEGGITSAAGLTAFVDYNLYNTASAAPTTGTPYVDMVRSIVAFSTATAPAAGTNPPAGATSNWESFSHLAAAGSTGGWNRGRFNTGLMPQTNTNFVLDGNGNLVTSLHVQYNERATWNLTGGTNNYADAKVSYSGGVASDYFQVADGSLTIGRWTGGQMTITDNNGILNPLVKNLGLTSAYWGLGTSTNPSVVQSLIGTTTFTQVGATRPTDTFGNVGTVPVASLVANFSAMTVDTRVDFTIVDQKNSLLVKDLSVAAMAVSIVPGGNYFDATYETGNEPTVSCAGAGCIGTTPGSYLGWMTGTFYGAGAGSADVSYKIWPTAAQGSVVSDIIQGVVAFTGTTPTKGANPATGLYQYVVGRVFLTSPTYVISGNAGNAAPLASSNILLDAAGNVVRVSQMSVNTGMAIGGATAAAPNQQVTFSGGVAQDYFKMADNSITFGRWLGGDLLIDDPVTLARTTLALKANNGITPTSGIWYMTTPLQSTNYVQSLTGTSSYNNVKDVSPTDSFGNVGMLNSATLTANFLAQTVDAVTNFTILSNTYDVSATGMPILIDSFLANPTTAIVPKVTCLQGTQACAGTYQGRLAGNFAGNTASSILLQYAAWPTTTAGVAATDTIRGLVALGSVAPPTLAPSKVVAITLQDANASSWIWNNTFSTLPGNINTATPNPGYSLDWGSGSASGESLTLAGATGAVNGSANSVASTGIQFGRYGSFTSYTQANWGSFNGLVGWNRTGQWAYGVTGYLDNSSILSTATNATITGQFGYVLDGSQSAPMDWNGNKGVLNSLTLSANFVTNKLSTSLQATQGASIWNASSTGVSISSFNPYFNAGGNGAGQVSTVTKGTLGTETCTTCSWYLNGAFTGQNYAGAVVSFSLSDNSTSMSSNGLEGVAALTRTGGTVSGLANPLVSNAAGTVAPTTNVVATSGANMGTNVQTQTSATLDANNVLTNFGSTTITCISCTGAFAPDFANTGIRLGTWDVGTSSSSWTNAVNSAQFHWITGPAAPQSLVQSLIGKANYTLDGGTAPTSQTQGVSGVSTGVINSASMTLDFNKQAVGLNFSVSSGAHNWVVSTPVGSEAPLGNNNGNGASAFIASTSMTGPGALSVLLDGVDVSSSAYVSKVSGQITGDTLNGALFQYQLAGSTSTPSTPSAVGTKTYTDSIAVLAPTMIFTGPIATGGQPGISFPAGTGTFVVQAPTTVTLTSIDGTTISSLSTTGGVAMNVATLTQQAPDTYAGFDSTTGEGVEVTIYSGAYSNSIGGLAYSSFGWLRKHPAIPALAPATATGPFANIYFAGGTVLTPTAAMSQAISATYTGGMEGAAQDSMSNILYLLSGTTSLTANFTNSSIVGSLTGISAKDTSTQLAAGFFNDLTINGSITSATSSFSGSVTAGVAPAASPVAIATGAATTGTTSGHFYGPNATEVSGTWALSSGTISASGAFGAANGTTVNPGLQTVNGTVALVQTSAPVDTATPARLMIETHIDPTNGFQASGDMNNATRVTTVAGAVTGFDLGGNNNNNSNLAFSTSKALSIGTAISVLEGSDATSGFSWGRWSGGNLQYTDRVTNAVTSVANTNKNLHWIAGPTGTSNVVLPVSGTFNYTLVGGTNPTDNLGNVGTLTSATLQANFIAQTVNMGVNATVNAINYAASGNNMPIQNAGFSNDGGGTYTATANGAAVQGFAGGIFTGATGTGAGVVYGFTNGATVVNGVAAFANRTPVLP